MATAAAADKPPVVAKKPGIFEKRDVKPGLHQVYPDPTKPGNNKFSVEIIAIPGLGADANYTWIREKVHWLRDEHMLANKISNARISVLEYASQWFGKGAVDQRVDQVAEKLLYYIKQNRSDHNKTPIIFVAHCLGGIILEKALLFSRLRQAIFPSIFPYIVGCVFLGTPFRGTKTQKKALALANMAEMVGLGVASNLLKVLEEDSELLMDMLDDFVRLTKEAQIRVFCFYEAQKSNIMSPFTKSAIVKQQEKIVDKAHATFPGVESLDLDSDHFGMNKYASPKDANFDLVAGQIKETASRAGRIIKSRENSASQKLVNESKYRELLDLLRENISDLDAVVKGLYRRKNIADVAATANMTQSDGKESSSSWIMEDEAFLKWREAKTSQLLWIHGPTVQKSIASSVIEDLEKMSLGTTDEHDALVLSFFCAESDEYRRALPNVLKLLIRQMITFDQDLAVHLLSDSKNSKKSGKQDFDKEALSKTAVLWDALQNMVASYSGRVYVLLYGVDELAEESLEQFMGYLKDVPSKNEQLGEKTDEPAIKWILLTRLKRPDVIKALTGRAHEIDFADEKNAEKVNDDLWSHISFQVDQLEISPPLKYFLKHHIHSRAQGNEVYVSLVIQEVKNKQAMGQIQHADIRALLESFPYGLTNMYEHIRKRVLTPTSEGIEYTKEILRCLALAQRAPTMRELAVMADLPHEEGADLETLKRYVIQCGSFVTLRGADYDEETMTVEWIDSTARIHLENFAKDELAMDLRSMQHGIIALRCLQYVYKYTSSLSHVDSNQNEAEEEDSDADEEDGENEANAETRSEGAGGSTGTSEAEEGQEAQNDDENEFITENKQTALRYPMENWLEHAKLSDADVISEFDTGHAFWGKDSPLRQTWWDDLPSLHMLESHTNVSALHVAALTAYPALVEYLLKNGWEDDIHHEDSFGFQPLLAASYVGNVEIVQQLLDAGADIHYISDSAEEEFKFTAIHTAAEKGHLEVVQTLLNRGADINVTSEDWGTPLYLACEHDFIEIIRLLLKNKADPNPKGGSEVRAINVAAWNGNVEAMQLLLDHGADVDPDDDYWYGSAIGAASRRGHSEAVKLLLSKGWSPTKRMENYGSFLTCAATYGHSKVVELLLTEETRATVLEQALAASSQNGKAEVVQLILSRKPDIRHERAFLLAATYGRDQVVELLFAKGLSQEKLDEALYVAADHERESTVNLLLSYGANPNAEGEIYGCTLTASAYDGTTNIMKALIDAGADVNKEGGDYGSPLQAAALFGNADNVKLLLNHGARLNEDPIGIYGYPLQAAAEKQDLATVQLLLDNQSDVNAFGGKYSYALIAAASDSDTMKVLLEYGADPNVSGGENNRPAIVIAAEKLWVDDMELILEKGADINATCDQGSTALIEYALLQYTEGLQMLISRGADIHISSQKLGTALHAAAGAGFEEGCKLLLEARADVTAEGGQFGTPLVAAAYSGDLNTLQLILDADVDQVNINRISGEAGTALQAACAFGHEDIVQKLLDQAANVNLQPSNGESGYALHAAAHAGEWSILDTLLEHGANVHLEGGEYGFALIAAACGKPENAEYCVETLLDHGASVSAVASEGIFSSAIAAAAFANNNSLLKLLISRGGDVHQAGGKYGSPLICAMIKAPEEEEEEEEADAADTPSDTCVDTLLLHGVDVNYRSSGRYHTALIAAAYFDRYEYVLKLLDHGADMRVSHDGPYRSAIAAAAIRGNQKILEKFLEMNPPSQLLDEALVESCAHRQSSSVKCLLQKGAYVYARHPQLGTAMEALTNPQPDVYNSDDDMNSDSDDDSSDEDSDDEDVDWEGDGESIAESDDESVADVPDESADSEEVKIKKLLEEMMQRVKRNPTVKRFNTTKRRQVPPSLNPNYHHQQQQKQQQQQQSFGANYPQYGHMQPNHLPSSVSPYSAYPPPPNVPPQYLPQQNQPHNMLPQHPPPQNMPPQNMPPQNMPPQNMHPQNMSPRNTPPQNPPPIPPIHQKRTVSGLIPRKPVSGANPQPPSEQAPNAQAPQTQYYPYSQVESSSPSPQRPPAQDYLSQDPSRTSANSSPQMNPGPGGRYQQRQSTYGSHTHNSPQQMQSPYATPPRENSYASSGPQPPYHSPPPSQQYAAPPHHHQPQSQPPPSQAYPQAYQQYPAQTQSPQSYMPSQTQYQPITSQQHPMQQRDYIPYSQQSQSSSSAASFQSGSTYYGNGQQTMYSTPNSSQASELNSQQGSYYQGRR